MSDHTDHFLIGGRLTPVEELDLTPETIGQVVGSRIDDRYEMIVAAWPGHVDITVVPPDDPDAKVASATVDRPAVRFGEMREARVNWPSIGLSLPRIAEAQAEALTLAAAIAQRLNHEAGL